MIKIYYYGLMEVVTWCKLFAETVIGKRVKFFFFLSFAHACLFTMPHYFILQLREDIQRDGRRVKQHRCE